MGIQELSFFFLGFITAFMFIGAARNIAIGIALFLIVLFILRYCGLVNI